MLRTAIIFQIEQPQTTFPATSSVSSSSPSIMKFSIALLALLTNSGAYANQGIRGSTTEYLQLPECPYDVSGSGSYTAKGVPKGKTMLVESNKNCVGCYNFPGPLGTTCKLSDACINTDSKDPVLRSHPGETTMTATGGTTVTGPCALRCYGVCELEEVPSEDYALDSFDMITKE